MPALGGDQTDFNTEAPEQVQLTRRVSIGWEHTVSEDADGAQTVEYVRDEDGNPVPRSYLIPTRLSTRQVLDRIKGIDKAVFQEVAVGDLGALLDVADALCGGGVVEAVGTDPTVPTEAFVRFVQVVLEPLSEGGFMTSLGEG